MDDNNDTTASCEVATHAERQESVGKGIPDDVQPDAPQFAEADDVMTTNHSDVSSEAEEALDNEIKTEDNGSNEDATAGHTQSKQDEKDDGLNAGVDKGSELTQADTSDKPFSIFTPNEKKFIMLCAGICAFFSPVSGQIYFPSLGAIARDLDVSYDLVTLTITTYLIMQGLAPAFVGGFSDNAGRRPAYLACFTIYLAANLGLALQSDYAALLVLRCMQSAGSSGTVALANAVVADIVTSQERGVYISYVSVAPQAGPAIGPIIGGLLGQYLGWHAIFWFLFIVAAVVLVPMAFVFPETCRKIVDDGSVPPPKWTRCYMNRCKEQKLVQDGVPIRYDRRDELARTRKLRFPNPLETFRILLTREAGFVLLYIGLVGAAYYATVALIPSQFGTIYGFNEIQIALCYLPLGAGSILAAVVRGRIIDARFRAHARRLGVPLKYNRRMDLSSFPLERARLEVAAPVVLCAAVFMIGFGWMLESHVSVAGPLVFLFVIGFCTSSALNVVSVLLVDIYPGKAGTATAANNLCRCWLGAGATAGVQPMIDKVGVGWTSTFFALLVLVCSPVLWWVMVKGPEWRAAAKAKAEREERDVEERADFGREKGFPSRAE